MQLQVLDGKFSVCKIENVDMVNFEDTYCFVSKTDDELSLVCKTASVPLQTIAREDNWLGFKVKGVLDFSLVGILSKISSILADEKIAIFAISTYNTDYVFAKEKDFADALNALANCGYVIS